MSPHRAVILVGHGGVPRDVPRELVTRLKALEGRRQAVGGEPSAEERELDARIRRWPRSAGSDPYRAGLERLGEALAPRLGGARLLLAYNEFCAPTLEEAIADAVAGGAREIVVVPSMITPGGVHSEAEIPEAVERSRAAFPDASIRYAWPFDLARVAAMLAEQVESFV